MLNKEQRQELAKYLARHLREDDANYLSIQYREPEQWTDRLKNDLEGWITAFNDEL